MTTKICTKCKNEKPINEFVRDNRLRSGYGSRCLTCCSGYGRYQYNNDTYAREDKLQKTKVRRSTSEEKRKRNEYRLATYRGVNGPSERIKNRDRIRLRRSQVNLLKSRPCVDCLNSFPPCCMDFDHVRGIKIRGIGEMVSHSSMLNILAEIEKCDLVCACCHRVRTWGVKNVVVRTEVQRSLAKLAVLKKNPCMDCGKIFPPVAMDFDHVRGEKAATVSQLISDSAEWDLVLQEIAKCDLVCANCHRIRTNIRRSILEAA